jgi:hypothetical protein
MARVDPTTLSSFAGRRTWCKKFNEVVKNKSTSSRMMTKLSGQRMHTKAGIKDDSVLSLLRRST